MVRKSLPLWFSAAAFLTAVSSVPAVFAADSKDQIEHRKAIMEGAAGHLSAIFSTLKDPGKFADNYQFHADSLYTLAKISADTFPEGSDKGKTKASADIWAKPDEFKQAVDAFIDTTEGLSQAAKTDDIGALVAAAKEVGGSCKGCHDDFKED